MRALIDPRLVQAIPEMWPSLCTIQSIGFTTSASDQQIPSSATNITGMVDIPCRMAPIMLYRPTDDEIRTSEVEEVFERRQLLLNGFFPQIVNRIMQAVVDGVVWPIRGVESDSQRLNTRLKLEQITP